MGRDQGLLPLANNAICLRCNVAEIAGRNADSGGWRGRHAPRPLVPQPLRCPAHSRLEKLLRTGQIRVDGGRAKASTRLVAGQSIRIPPLPVTAPTPSPAPKALSKADRAFLASITL